MSHRHNVPVPSSSIRHESLMPFDVILAEMSWRLAWNDPTPLGFCIAAAHLLASGLSYATGRIDRRQAEKSSIAWFWFVLALAMLGLGLNKQLDLQNLLTAIGREIARQGGWISQRRTVQFVFVCICITIGLISAGA